MAPVMMGLGGLVLDMMALHRVMDASPGGLSTKCHLFTPPSCMLGDVVAKVRERLCYSSALPYYPRGAANSQLPLLRD